MYFGCCKVVKKGLYFRIVLEEKPLKRDVVTLYKRKRRYRFLEEIIRDIVDADKVARHQIHLKQEERRNIQNLIQDQSQEIKKKYQAETNQCIQELKGRMSDELSKQMQDEEKIFQETQAALTQKFEDHREAWVNEIVERCLTSFQ